MGTILWTLITRQDGHQNLDFSHEESREPQPFAGNGRLPYDSYLLDTITQCMRYQPKDRPSFDELLQRATSQLSKGGGWNLTAFLGLEHMKAENYTKFANGTAFKDLGPPIGSIRGKLVPLAHPPKDATASAQDLNDLGGPTGARFGKSEQLETRKTGGEQAAGARAGRAADAAGLAGRPSKRKASDEAGDVRSPSKRHKAPTGEGGRHPRPPTAPTGPTPPVADPTPSSHPHIAPPAQDPTAIPAQGPVPAPAAAQPAPPQGLVNCGGHAQNGQRCKRRLKPRDDGRPPFCAQHAHQRP